MSKHLLFIFILLMVVLLPIMVFAQDPFYRPWIQGDSLIAGKYLGSASGTATITIADSTINWATGNRFTKTLGANQRFVFSNLSDGQTINVAVSNTTSNYTVTWVSSIAWKDGVTPTQTIGAKTDVYSFKKVGSITYGAASQNY